MADNNEENIQENNDVNKADTNKNKKTSSVTKKKTPTKTVRLQVKKQLVGNQLKMRQQASR